MSDLIYLPTYEGLLYHAAVLDLFALVVVGWAMWADLEREVTLAALTDTIGRHHPAPGFLHCSDWGSQYTSSD